MLLIPTDGTPRSNASTLPDLIVRLTLWHLVIGAIALVCWRITQDFAPMQFYFTYQGSIFLVGSCVLELAAAIAVLRYFSRDEPLHPAWFIIVLAAASRLIGNFMAHVLGVESSLNPLSKAQSDMLHGYGLLIGGPMQMALLSIGLIFVLRVYRKLNISPHLSRIDWLLLAIVLGYNVHQFYRMLFWPITAQPGDTPTMAAIRWGTDPLLGILLIEAILIRGFVAAMAGSQLARCWRAYAIAIFLTTVGNIGIWAVNYRYIPWPYNSITWYIWYPAAAAYALGPAYQLTAVRRALAGVRERVVPPRARDLARTAT